MRAIVVAMLCASTFLGIAQEQTKQPSTPPWGAPPTELKMVDFMLGEWSKSETGEMAGKKGDITFRLFISKALGGRYVQVKHVHNLPGEPDVEGMRVEGTHMLTYDPDKKLWRAWWFSSTDANVSELSGSFEGNKLQMVSKPFQIPRPPGERTIRASWRMTSERGLNLTIEFKQGDSWVTFIDRTYVKK